MNGAPRTSDGSTKRRTEVLPNATLTMDVGNAIRSAGPKDSVVAGWYERHPSDVSRELHGVRPGPVTRTVEFVKRLALEPKGNPGSIIALMLRAASDVVATDLEPTEIGERFRALRATKASADAEELRAVVELASLVVKQPESRAQVRDLLAKLGGYPPQLIAVTEANLGLLIYTQALMRAYGRDG